MADANVRYLAGGEVWREIQRLAARRSRGRVMAAISFVSQDLLNLAEGDVLVTNLDKGVLRAGMTDPTVLARLVARKVTVLHRPKLHAKVVVVAGKAIVGSANMSVSSRDALAEAAVMVSGTEAVAEARFLVQQLADQAQPVDKTLLSWAKSEYRQPMSGTPADPNQRDPFRPPTIDDRFWWLPVEEVVWTAATQQAYQEARSRVRRAVGPASEVALDAIEWPGELKPMAIGDVVLQIWTDSDDTDLWVAPPARIVADIPVTDRGRSGHRRLIYLAAGPAGGYQPLSELAQQADRRSIPDPGSDTREIRSSAIKAAALRLWPNRVGDL